MGSNIGKNAGSTAASIIASAIREFNINFEQGLQELKKFKESIDKNVDTLTDVLNRLDNNIYSFLVTLVIVLIIIFLYGFSYLANKFIIKNPSFDYSIITFINSMKYFSIILVIILPMIAVYLKDETCFEEVFQVIILFAFLPIFVFLVVFIDWIFNSSVMRNCITIALSVIILFMLINIYKHPEIIKPKVIKTDSCFPFKEINGSCYEYIDKWYSRNEAEEVCKYIDNSSFLPMIRNDDELNTAKNLAIHYNVDFFWVNSCIKLS